MNFVPRAVVFNAHLKAVLRMRIAIMTESLSRGELAREKVRECHLRFLVELLTSGVYGGLFDSLPTQNRDTSRELWGRLFELYTAGVARNYSVPTRTSVNFRKSRSKEATGVFSVAAVAAIRQSTKWTFVFR